MPRIAKELTQRELNAAIKQAKQAGKPKPITVGGVRGLCLRVNGERHASWIYRKQGAHSSSTGLGSYPEVSLAEAREKAREAEALAADDGKTPAQRKREERERREAERQIAALPTLDQLAEMAIRERARSKGWSTREETRERNSYRKHIKPLLGAKRIDTIDGDDVFSVWRKARGALCGATAKKVTGRLRSFLDYAVAEGYIRENPARGARFYSLLKTQPKENTAGEEHRGALAPEDVSAFVAELCERIARREAEGHSAQPERCLLFSILTNSRGANAREARWGCIDGSVWTIPAREMKCPANGAHTVFLSSQALALIRAAPAFAEGSPLLFPSARNGTAMSDAVFQTVLRALEAERKERGAQPWLDKEQTLRKGAPVRATQHGTARASFRTWAETALDPQTGACFSKDAAELSLHHRKETGDGLGRSYARSELKEERRRIAEEWGRFCLSATPGEVWKAVTNAVG